MVYELKASFKRTPSSKARLEATSTVQSLEYKTRVQLLTTTIDPVRRWLKFPIQFMNTYLTTVLVEF